MVAPKKQRAPGFTIIEVLVVMAIVGMILAIVFFAVPQLQKSQRDSQRRGTAQRVYAALLEFYSRNGKYPACDSGSGHPCSLVNTNDATKFIISYMPTDRDPSTGEQYAATPITADTNTAKTDNDNMIYIFDAAHVDHSFKPRVGQVYIGSGHWCYLTKPDDGPATNPIASNSLYGPDPNVGKFVVLIGLEKGDYFCLDNYSY